MQNSEVVVRLRAIYRGCATQMQLFARRCVSILLHGGLGGRLGSPLKLAITSCPQREYRFFFFFSQWVTHRDARWFADPEGFIPGRWLDQSTAKLPRFAYLPFGGGPRVCISAGFATMEAMLLLAVIAQRFQLRLVPGQRIEPLPSITLRPKHGIWVELRERRGTRATATAH